MQTLPNITLTNEECKNLLRNRRFAKGGESVICHSDNQHTLYKIFVIDPTIEIATPMSDNKFSKIKSLYKKRLEHATHPLSTISMNGELIGYEMTYDPAFIPLEKMDLSRKEMIRALKETREILLYFDSKDITYSDIKSDNILINPKTHKIMFCDMDNTRVGEYPVDLKCFNLMRFYEIYGKMDNVVQAYMHNLLTLQQLGFTSDLELPSGELSTSYHSIITALRHGKRPTKFKQGANEIFDSMTSPQTFNGEYAIQYIKR